MTQHAINVRDGIVASIRAAFPVESVPEVGPYDGVVDRSMVERYTVRSPAVLVTILGGKTAVVGSSVYDHLQIGLYILTKGRTHTQRSNAALMIRERLANLLHHADVYPDGTHKPPREIEWSNMFDGEIDEMGLVLWAGAWEHTVELPPLEDIDSLDDFARMWLEIFNPGEVPDEVETGDALAEQLIELELETEEP